MKEKVMNKDSMIKIMGELKQKYNETSTMSRCVRIIL